MPRSHGLARSVVALLAALAVALGLALGPLAQGLASGDVVSCESARKVLGVWTTSLRGDVDGDGTSDSVRTRAIWLANGECRAWLSVDTARGRFRASVVPTTTPLLKPPGLAGLIRLGPGRTLSVAVVVWLGASTGFLDVYSLRHHALERVNADEYTYAGSVVHPSGVDCSRRHGARLVASTANYAYSDNRYHVTRLFYASRGGLLTLVPRLTERFRVRLSALDRFPELVSQPFASCTAVQGSA